MKGEFERIMLEYKKALRTIDKQAQVIHNLVAERATLVLEPDSEAAEQIRKFTKKYHEKPAEPPQFEGIPATDPPAHQPPLQVVRS